MKFPTSDEVKKIREEYPVGTKVKLIKMDDKYAPKVGTCGIVKGVDDAGNIMVNWDNGSTLSVVYGADKCVKISAK